MNSISKWKVLDEFDFELIHQEPTQVTKDSLDYYEYINSSRNRMQTGKNVQCIKWLVEHLEPGMIVEESFGGVGIFAIAIQNLLKPAQHRITELSPHCVEQLHYALRNYSGIKIYNGKAEDTIGISDDCDVCIMDFPLFTYSREVTNPTWVPHLKRLLSKNPKLVTITDGARFHYHLHWDRLNKKFGLNLTNDFHSYIEFMSIWFYEHTGYSIPRCGFHGSCFYYSLEAIPPSKIEYLHFGEGTGPAGLRSA